MHLELVRDEDRSAIVLAAAGDMLDEADAHPDPTEAGALVARATRLIHAHRRSEGWQPRRAARPWTVEEEGDHAADEARIESRAA